MFRTARLLLVGALACSRDPKFQWTAGARLYLSCQLYLATGEQKFHEAIKEPAAAVFGLAGEKPQFPAQYLGHLEESAESVA